MIPKDRDPDAGSGESCTPKKGRFRLPPALSRWLWRCRGQIPGGRARSWIGNDEKIVWDDEGKSVLSPPGKDSVIVDVAEPEEPKIVVSLPLENTVVGPPVNMAFSQKGDIGLVANSIDVVQDGGALKQVPDDRIYAIDMKANPPKLAATIKGGRQPSGLSISPSGNMALVANREDKSISVLSINGTDVKVTDRIAMGDSVAHLAIAPDGKHALAVKFPAHKAALLDIAADGKVTYNKYDIATGFGPTMSTSPRTASSR
jgi:hypothetical protein